MKKNITLAEVSKGTILLRKTVNLFVNNLFPNAIIDDKYILNKINQEAKKGRGLLVVFTHFSYRDPIDLVRSLMRESSIIMKREVVSPISFHQYSKLLYKITNLVHVSLFPVVNQDTLERKGFTHLKKGEGLSEFASKSAEILAKGGMVPIAVNAGRREKLDLEDKQRPIGFFIAATQSKNSTNYGVLLVSVSIKDAQNYTKKEVGGLNLGKTYNFNLTNYFTLEELLSKPEINGKLGNVDSFLRKKLAEVSPKNYLPISSNNQQKPSVTVR